MTLNLTAQTKELDKALSALNHYSEKSNNILNLERLLNEARMKRDSPTTRELESKLAMAAPRDERDREHKRLSRDIMAIRHTITSMKHAHYSQQLDKEEAKLINDAAKILHRLGGLQILSGRRVDAAYWWNKSIINRPSCDERLCKEMAEEISNAEAK